MIVLVLAVLLAAVLGVEAAAIGALLAIERLAGPRVDRWLQGARGEERVGSLLDHGGVCIITARMLVAYLRRRRPALTPDQVRRIAAAVS